MARGFTALELLLAVAVVAILATLAVPGFTQALQRTRRLEAVTALMQVQLAQERFRSTHAAYAPDLAALGLDANASVHYRIAITDSGAQRHAASATPTGVQAADTACAQLGLTLVGGSLSLHSTGSARSGECWSR